MNSRFNKIKQILFVLVLAGVSANASTLNIGLKGKYLFESSTEDSSGNGFHLNNFGAVLTADRFGNANNAYNFTGGSFMQTSLPNLSNFTISAWVYQPSLDKNYFETVASSETFRISLIGNDSILSPFAGFAYSNGGYPNAGIASGANSFEINKWANFTVTKNSNSVQLFIDGILVSAGNSSPYNITIATLRLGSDGLTGIGANDFISGFIDDVYVYERALTSSEVVELVNTPEPSSLSLLLACGAVLLGMRNTRRTKI